MKALEVFQHEPQLTNFGIDAIGRWFTETEVIEIVEFANRHYI